MGQANRLTAKDLAELALFLYDSGDSAFRQGNLLHASNWFAQSLSVFGQLHANNDIWIAALLLSLGKIALQAGQVKHAQAFLEACSNICARLPEDEVVQDYQEDLTKLFAKVNLRGKKERENQPHEFLIVGGNVTLKKVNITTAGEIQWSVLAVEENAPPVELGLRTTWRVIPS